MQNLTLIYILNLIAAVSAKKVIIVFINGDEWEGTKLNAVEYLTTDNYYQNVQFAYNTSLEKDTLILYPNC